MKTFLLPSSYKILKSDCVFISLQAGVFKGELSEFDYSSEEALKIFQS